MSHYNLRKRDVVLPPTIPTQQKHQNRVASPIVSQYNLRTQPKQKIIQKKREREILPPTEFEPPTFELGEATRKISRSVLSGKSVAQAKQVIGSMTRMQLLNMINNAFAEPNASEMCVREANDREFLSNFLLSEMLGSGSANGEAHKICTPYVCNRNQCECAKTSVTLSIKLIPIGFVAWESFESSKTTPHSLKMVQNKGRSDEEKYELWVELTAMTLANQLVIQGVCPNLPLMFRWFICRQCNYQNQKLMERVANPEYIPDSFRDIMRPVQPLTWAQYMNPLHVPAPPKDITIEDVQKAVKAQVKAGGEELLNPCAIVVNELASGGDLRHWLKGKKLSYPELSSMMFQITAGFYALEKYFGMRHYDAHLGNVLAHKLPHKEGVYKYRIDGRDYYVPHFGWLFVLWDFGMARIEDGNGKTLMGAFSEKSYAAEAKNPLTDISNVSALIDEWDIHYGKGANSVKVASADLVAVYDENDANNEALLKTLESKQGSYTDIFPSKFKHFLSIGRNTIDSSWDMDKQLTPFDDADLQQFVKF